MECETVKIRRDLNVKESGWRGNWRRWEETIITGVSIQTYTSIYLERGKGRKWEERDRTRERNEQGTTRRTDGQTGIEAGETDRLTH
jgi:hypothetical protein